MFDAVQLNSDLLSLDIPHIRQHPFRPEVSAGENFVNFKTYNFQNPIRQKWWCIDRQNFLPLGEIVGGEGGGVVGGQSDQVVEDASSLIERIIMIIAMKSLQMALND